MSKRIYSNATRTILITTCLIFIFINLANSQTSGYVPKEGFVPNAETAIKIAEAIWLPIYGEEIYSERPFVAKLNKNGNWIIQGTLPKGYDGGTAYAEIRKKDCKVIKVFHSK